MANATCGPMWVLDTSGTIAGCNPQIQIHSAAVTGYTGVAEFIVQLEDLQGRTVLEMRTRCDQFWAFTRPLTVNGLFLRTMTGGRLYVQVG